MIAESMEISAPRTTSIPTPESRSFLIRKVAVLGAGNMGSRIAAHFANAGIPVVLLDIVPENTPAGDPSARSKLARNAVEASMKSKPAAFFDPALARLVNAGNFEDDLEKLHDCDWIIEAVSENLAIKRALLQKFAPFRRTDAIVTTNTSGLPINQIAEEMDLAFRQHWFGTHFFNPPRYMRLLEIIPGPDTSQSAIEVVKSFADKRLGKTVVVAKDTPNFIGNRIGTFALMNAIRVMQSMDLSIEQVDALTGSAIGWPKTGTFRLSDLVGIDVLANVAKNFFDRVRDERSDLQLPDFINKMLERNWLGDKVGQGFYKKTKSATGEELRLGLDWRTLEYRPSERAKFPAIDMAKNAESLSERLKMLLAGDPRKDQAAAFYWQILPELWNYAANRIGEIADDILSIDRAMKTGFNWELGPFELWDAAGVASTAEKMTALAPEAKKLLGSGHQSWYRDDPSGRQFFDIASGEYKPIPVAAGVASVSSRKKSYGVIKKNPGASLVDLGDGIACIEFHTKMNSIGTDILQLVTQVLRPGSELVANFEAFVIANDSDNFSAGANLMQLLLGIQEQEWDEIDATIRAFQNMTQAIKFCPRPVVVAPAGLALGGGCEVALHGAAREAHAELYMGLVETGVGLVPAGGGCKETVLQSTDAAARVGKSSRNESVELIDDLRQRFETIAMAKVSTSAFEARSMGYLSPSDGITMNRDRLLSDAKARAREMARAGYVAPLPRADVPAPGENILASFKMGVRLMREGEFISDHDVKIANWVAYILCGGNVTPGSPVSEQYLLDLERQAFLSLCGEQKTAERIAYTLKNGRPLRN
jgi:3-hydroxyacyl-CoA dehydrogenase